MSSEMDTSSPAATGDSESVEKPTIDTTRVQKKPEDDECGVQDNANPKDDVPVIITGKMEREPSPAAAGDSESVEKPTIDTTRVQKKPEDDECSVKDKVSPKQEDVLVFVIPDKTNRKPRSHSSMTTMKIRLVTRKVPNVRVILEIERDALVKDLREKASKVFKIPADQVSLIFAGKKLKDSESLLAKDENPKSPVVENKAPLLKPVSTPESRPLGEFSGGIERPTQKKSTEYDDENMEDELESDIEYDTENMEDYFRKVLEWDTESMDIVGAVDWDMESVDNEVGSVDWDTRSMGSEKASVKSSMSVDQKPESPEVRFHKELQQLQEMGFYDRETNLQVLMRFGSVSAAIEYIIEGAQD